MKKIILITISILMFLICKTSVKAKQGDLVYDVSEFIQKSEGITIEGWAFIHRNNNIGGKTLFISIMAKGQKEGKSFSKEYKNEQYSNGDSLFPLLCNRNANGYCIETPKNASCDISKESTACQYRNTNFSITIPYEELARDFDSNNEIELLIKVRYKTNNKRQNTNEEIPVEKKLAVSKTNYLKHSTDGTYEVTVNGINTSFHFTAKSAYYQGISIYNEAVTKIEAIKGDLLKQFTFNRNYTIEISKELQNFSWDIGKNYAIKINNIRIYKLNTKEMDKVQNDYWAYATWGQVEGGVTLNISKKTISDEEPMKNNNCQISDILSSCTTNINVKKECSNYTLSTSKTAASNIDLQYKSDSGCDATTFVYYRDVKLINELDFEYELSPISIYKGGPFNYSVTLNNEFDIISQDREVKFIKYNKIENKKCKSYYNVLYNTEPNDSEEITDSDKELLEKYDNDFNDLKEEIKKIIDDGANIDEPTSSTDIASSNYNKKNNTTGETTAFLAPTKNNGQWKFALKYSGINRKTGEIIYRDTQIENSENQYIDINKQVYYVPLKNGSNIFQVISTITAGEITFNNIKFENVSHKSECNINTYSSLIPPNKNSTYLINYRVVDLNKMFPNILPHGYTNGDSKYGANWFEWISNKYNDVNTKDEVNTKLSSYFATNNEKEYTVNLTKANLKTILDSNNSNKKNEITYSKIVIDNNGTSKFIKDNNSIFSQGSNPTYSYLGMSGIK